MRADLKFGTFKDIVSLSLEDLCRELFIGNRENIKVKKETVAVKNLVKIFNAALTLSNQKGFKTMSLRDLSAEAGLSMGALYAYFTSKEELLHMIQRQGRMVVKRVLEDQIEGVDDPRTKLRRMILIMGCPFYVMERIRGIILRRDLPRGLEFTPDQMRSLCDHLLDLHCNLHSIDYKVIGLEGFGKPEGYVKRQVEGWSERYRTAHTPDAAGFEKVMQWLHDKVPPDFPKPAIIHNDYKLDNVVLDPRNPAKIIGVLDWEMATIGDPLMDLGSSLGYWVQSDDSPVFQTTRTLPTNRPGALTRDEMVKRYSEKARIPINNFDFYLCFGLFRLAVIAQQINYRFYHGQTKDERFKSLSVVVRVLEEEANRTMEHSGL